MPTSKRLTRANPACWLSSVERESLKIFAVRGESEVNTCHLRYQGDLCAAPGASSVARYFFQRLIRKAADAAEKIEFQAAKPRSVPYWSTMRGCPGSMRSAERRWRVRPPSALIDGKRSPRWMPYIPGARSTFRAARRRSRLLSSACWMTFCKRSSVEISPLEVGGHGACGVSLP